MGAADWQDWRWKIFRRGAVDDSVTPSVTENCTPASLY